MTTKEAIVLLLKANNLLECRQTLVSAFWDDEFQRYRVDEMLFFKLDDAAEEFIKRTAHGRRSKTDDEAECSTRRD